MCWGKTPILPRKKTPPDFKKGPYNKRKQKKFDGDRDLREQFSFLPLLIRPLLITPEKRRRKTKSSFREILVQ